MKRIGIIGAGRFGMALAESLANAGTEVLLIDRNRPAMQNASATAHASATGHSRFPPDLDLILAFFAISMPFCPVSGRMLRFRSE